ncbi:TIGR04104 family putative zinc finger protein [Priestia koreensis]|uniref:TIGR04104 family putative zinc finger protein n=1 Tax=Priestia koreensis TaxID=284581 RepID=UPI001F5AC2B1|nr:TIGR04104 family putative zinc finger protein [Priestia koreensis]MCM3004104.1 hypothetical protein [Priestia koreensis]UNL83323.1 hypothetical protein IE339_14215 [Priestia koreensis]
MQKCTCCGQSFSWKEVCKASAFLYSPLTCKNCGTEHTITVWTRLLMGLFISIPMTSIIFFLDRYHLSIGYQIISIFLYLVLITLFFPYLARYKRSKNNTNEHS